MDQVILANQQSEFEKVDLKNANGGKDLQYAKATPYPIFGKAYKTYNPRLQMTSGIPYTQQLTYDVANSFYNNMGRVRFDYSLTCTTLEASVLEGVPLALMFLEYIRFMDNGVQLAEIKGDAYRALVWNMPQHKRDYIMRYAQVLGVGDVTAGLSNGANNNLHSFLPLMTSWLAGSFEKSINTTLIQTMQIELKFKSADQMGLKTTALTNFSSTIDMRYWKPEDSIYRSLLAKNYTNPLVMETWDTVVEVIPVTAGLSSGLNTLTWNSKAPYFTFKTVPFIAKANMTVNTVLACPVQKITKVSVDLGGTPWIQNYTRSMLEYEGVFNGGRSAGISTQIVNKFDTSVYAGEQSICTSANECVVIDYSALCSEASNTGGAFFQKLLNPYFQVEFDFAPYDSENSSAYNLYLCHYYWRNTTLEGGYAQSSA